jgi:hypothetical protein
MRATKLYRLNPAQPSLHPPNKKSQHMVPHFLPAAFVLTALASATVVTALADDTPKGTLKHLSATAPQNTRQAPLPQRIANEPAPQHLYLIRTTLLTLDTANRTGNYTVLRDSAGPGFQQKNSAADLAMAFQQVRATLDLSAVALRTPVLSRQPAITPERQLHLSGLVPGEPKAIAFDMIFEPINGHWLLSGLAVGMAQK